MVGRAAPSLSVAILFLACSSPPEVTSNAVSEASPASVEAGEAKPLGLNYKEERKRQAQLGLLYDSGKVVIDPAVAATIVAGPDPRQALEEFQRGQDLLAKNWVLDAIQAHTKAVLLAPDDPKMYLGLGDALRAKPWEDKAEAAYRTAMDLGVDTPELRYTVAMLLLLQGEREAGLDQLESTLDLDPNHVQALERLAINRYYVGQYAEAWDAVHRAEALGHSVPPQFMALLTQVAPEGR